MSGSTVDELVNVGMAKSGESQRTSVAKKRKKVREVLLTARVASHNSEIV